MAEATKTTTTSGRQDRVQLVGEIIDRVGGLLSLGAVAAFAGGVVVFLAASLASRWWTVALVAVALVAGSAVADERRVTDFATAAEFVAYAEAICVQHGREATRCMAEIRQAVAGLTDSLAMRAPRLVAECEAEYENPIAVGWCAARTIEELRRGRQP